MKRAEKKLLEKELLMDENDAIKALNQRDIGKNVAGADNTINASSNSANRAINTDPDEKLTIMPMKH